jgi:hypothetical protein
MELDRSSANHRRSRSWRVALWACCLAATIPAWRPPVRAQDRPLPDRDPFLAEVRKRLKSDDRLQSQYTFTEHQVRVDFDGDARPEKKTSKTFEVYPSVDGSPSYRRLIAMNDVPVPLKKVEEADRKHREDMQAWVRARQHETDRDRAERERKERADQQEEARVIDDIARVYDIRLVGREIIRSRPAIVMTLVPRPGVQPLQPQSAPMTKLRGRAWVDEQDCEVVRVQLESTDAISFGWGLLARVQKGTTLSFERRKVNDEVWLPARVAAHPKARIALLKRLDAEIVSDYSEYRKFTVDTAVSFAPIKQPR